MDEYEETPQPSTTNVLGIVGFVFAFCVSPLGLILSLMSLARPPRGFGIAGVIIGLLGSVVWGVAGFMIWAVVPMAVETNDVVTDVALIRQSIAQFQASNDGALPADLSALNLGPDDVADPWGTPYRYEPTGESMWTLVVAGPDGTFDDGTDAEIPSTMSEPDVMNLVLRTFAEQRMRDRFGNP